MFDFIKLVCRLFNLDELFYGKFLLSNGNPNARFVPIYLMLMKEQITNSVPEHL